MDLVRSSPIRSFLASFRFSRLFPYLLRHLKSAAPRMERDARIPRPRLSPRMAGLMLLGSVEGAFCVARDVDAPATLGLAEDGLLALIPLVVIADWAGRGPAMLVALA